MLYRLIEKARNRWFQSDDCSVKSLTDYMLNHGKLRDAQLESVKTFLYLKIACKNKPLWLLMSQGQFNSFTQSDLDELPIKASTRTFLSTNPAALALYEYAISKDNKGCPTSEKLADAISNAPASLDYDTIIKSLFYNVSYTDYLFSIPMGAGKTWLMSAFVYLNLYFAINEPYNPLFAHNFIVLAPAGLKSSIIPSLKDMQEFDPTFILPEPTASQIKAILKYEILEEDNSSKGSNIVKNPNALKIQLHQPFNTLRGLVVITNAEKLYDRVGHSTDTMPSFDFSEKERDEWLKTSLANELRTILSQLPNLSIMIDEVHHAGEEQLLRKVVEKWTAESTFNSVIGFSGTPYLSNPERIKINGKLTIKNSMFSNVITYYPLVNAVGNFLKIPEIKSSADSSESIIQNGVRDFFDKFRHTVYPDVGAAKLAIYCGRIETLETLVLPIVTSVCREYGLDPNDAVLKYYRNGSKSGYKCPDNAEAEFKALDSPLSKVRIVLLVQIGKEGWNCKSLTGVILPNENSSPKNMVLQTSCRCLREICSADKEYALIWLNRFNKEKLDEQLRKEHHTSIDEIQKKNNKTKAVKRFSRQNIVKLPNISYLQLKITYSTSITGEARTGTRLRNIVAEKHTKTEIIRQDLAGNEAIVGLMHTFEYPDSIEFNHWLGLISKESFGTLDVRELKKYRVILAQLFEKVTEIDHDGIRRYNQEYNQEKLRADIRRCFSKPTSIKCHKEEIPSEASLLDMIKFEEPYYTSDNRIIFPDDKTVQEIIDNDVIPAIPEHILEGIKTLRSHGCDKAADAMQVQFVVKPNEINSRTYQYIPYTFDSGLEKNYYLRILRPMLEEFDDIEIYFNGDESMTEFYIDCYQYNGSFWKNIGKYYPDFLILRRNSEGVISKVIIAETKGKIHESSFLPKKKFMKDFIQINNRDGNTKFDFLYIPETTSETDRYTETKARIKSFLNS